MSEVSPNHLRQDRATPTKTEAEENQKDHDAIREVHKHYIIAEEEEVVVRDW